MPAPPGGLALLIGKRLDKKGGGGGGEPPAGPPMADDGDGDDDQKEAMETSAINDFMTAKDPETAKAALKDFLASCYPQLQDNDAPEEEPEPEPEA